MDCSQKVVEGQPQLTNTSYLRYQRFNTNQFNGLPAIQGSLHICLMQIPLQLTFNRRGKVQECKLQLFEAAIIKHQPAWAQVRNCFISLYFSHSANGTGEDKDRALISFGQILLYIIGFGFGHLIRFSKFWFGITA